MSVLWHIKNTRDIIGTEMLRYGFGCAGESRLSYYHQSTFLQLNTIRFLLPFPLHLIPSDISGSRRNDCNSVSAFLFRPLFVVIARTKFWTDLFATRRAAEFKVRQCTSRIVSGRNRVLRAYTKL